MTDSRESVTGKRLILEILQELRDGLHPLLYSRVAPGLYCVYLHPEDFARIEGLVPRIRGEAQRALTEEVRHLNAATPRAPALRWFVAAEALPPVEEPAGGWEIQIEPDRDGEVARGTFVILSKLTLPSLPQFEGGSPTTKVFKTVVRGETRTKTEQVFVAEKSPAVPVVAPVMAPAPPEAARLPLIERPEDTARQRTDRMGRGLAEIVVQDSAGRRVFVMDKPDIKIGRGGQFRLVDLQIDGPARVSRVHARIRRDEQGRFFIKDLSEWGTTVDGRRIARGAVKEGDEVREIDVESELPPQARIGLAEVVYLDFAASVTAAEPEPVAASASVPVIASTPVVASTPAVEPEPAPAAGVEIPGTSAGASA